MSTNVDSASREVSALQALVRAETFVIIGHRGAAGLAPENTLPSFAHALALGCPMLELDVHRIADTDTELAVIHDRQLARTTNQRGLVDQLKQAELAEVDAGAGAAIPTLSDVLELLLQHDAARSPERYGPHGRDPDTPASTSTHLNIELKGANTAHAANIILQTTGFRHARISSFEHEQLFEFRQLNAHTPVAPLLHKWQPDIANIAQELGASAVNISSKIASAKRIQALRSDGYYVFVYTVNSLREARKLYQWGVNGVFTDRPDIITRTAVLD